jgi:Holliday junction resolvasome RuvABC endonuclease subunit|tara:strand:- start:2974 stop:3558 length:585 start_codon:yes stop_codon:yes gene_type:complete
MKQRYQTKPTTIVGIDYSLTSPSICVNNIDENKIKFYYLTTKKKWLGKQSDNIIGYEHKEWTDPIERFKNISDFILDILYTNPLFDQPNYQIFIEGYSYGSKGQGLFQIAENCGILKYRLQDKGYTYETVVPSVVKKGATGKGNADKDMMYESFLKETKINLKKILDTEKCGNPLSDIVDSYYIQKVGHENKSS